jgi:hypothetical protein
MIDTTLLKNKFNKTMPLIFICLYIYGFVLMVKSHNKLHEVPQPSLTYLTNTSKGILASMQINSQEAPMISNKFDEMDVFQTFNYTDINQLNKASSYLETYGWIKSKDSNQKNMLFCKKNVSIKIYTNNSNCHTSQGSIDIEWGDFAEMCN